MSGERAHRTRHSVEVAAPAGAVYALLADAERRPLYCPPVLHVERLDFDGPRERLRSWESAAGDIRSSISARVRHPHERRIEFFQLRHEAPLASMGGEWTVEEAAAGRSVVTVRHEFTVMGDRPDDVAWVGLVTDDNARAELESLRRIAESGIGLDHLVLSFEESVRVNGPGELVYDFLYRAADWPGLVPHVPRLDLTESSPGVQVLDYDVRLPDGAVRTASSVRLCFPHAGRIVHKQTMPAVPAAAAHVGEWTVVPDESGVRVLAQHSVLLDENAVRDLPSGIGQARLGLREDVGSMARATLELAKRHAESAVRALPLRPAPAGTC
ncbi:SRPBCC family protein [Streptomyces sp. NPDC050516]|uniref:SRPBCC family protein n=1 Tax=Streptomyces sp. NPDC050516 TaxID=3365621 RepID=UPI0037AD51C3